MKYFTIALFLGFFSIPQAEARHYTHYGHSYNNATEISFVSCRRKLRREGFLSHGKGAHIRNFHLIDDCVRNGGRI